VELFVEEFRYNVGPTKVTGESSTSVILFIHYDSDTEIRK